MYRSRRIMKRQAKPDLKDRTGDQAGRMSSLAAAIVSAVTGLLLPTALAAADIKLISRQDQEGSWVQGGWIQISGRIEPDDDGKFMALAASLPKATVLLSNSPGGSLQAAFTIGRIIRARAYATVIEGKCLSACAIVWLAGMPRIRGADAKIGFHSASALDHKTKERKSSSSANAEKGAYLKELGLSEEFIGYASAAPIDDFNYLDDEDIAYFRLGVIDIDRPSSRATRESYRWHNTAVSHSFGIGAPADLAEATRLYKLAAEANYAGSQNNLGDKYQNGTGVPKAAGLAIYWFTRAAERGEPTAYLSLSSYLPELGEDRDTLVQAAKFAVLASRKLHDGKNRSIAESNRANLEKRLSAEDYSQAVMLADKWVPLYREPALMGDAPTPK